MRRVIRGKDRRRRVMVMVGSKKWRGNFEEGAEGLKPEGIKKIGFLAGGRRSEEKK